MTELAQPGLAARTAGAPDLPAAAELDHALRNATPAAVIASAVRTVGHDFEQGGRLDAER